MTEGILCPTTFQFMTLGTSSMVHRTSVEAAIADMRTLIVRHKKGTSVEDVYEEYRIQVEHLSAVVVQLQPISDTIGVD